jgi:CRISPR-associated protein Cst2
MGTLVSIAPVSLVDDFGTMARHDGNPVPHEHQFYKATLQGMFSLNLTTAGSSFHGGRVGYRNLDDHRVKKAEKAKLRPIAIHGQPAFRLPHADRASRAATLVRAIGELEGGAKLTLHYTDVTPGVLIAAVTKAGNHPFSRVFRANSQREPEVVIDAVKEVLRVYKDQLLSKVFVGWAKGYLDDERAKVEALTDADRSEVALHWGHPREVMAALAREMEDPKNSPWYN